MKKKIFSTLLLVAFALASTSMFVSCKDYDDDFAKRDADIAALRAELENRLAECKANCDREHAKFLTEHQSLAGYAKLSDIPSLDGYAKLTDIPSLEGYATLEDVQKANDALAALQAELAEYVKAEAIKEALAYIKSLQDNGLTADGLSELMKKVKAIDESLGDYAKIDYVDQIVATAVENIEQQIEALDLYEKALDKAGIEPDKVVELLNKIDELKIEIKKYPADDLTPDEVKTLRQLLAKASEIINREAGPDINMIQYLIDKTLASIILKPDTYVAGLATIEVPALYYQPVIYVKDANSKEEAYYYIDKNGKKLSGADWRFDDGTNAPSATIPTWDNGFTWSNDFSGYDYTGEPEAEIRPIINQKNNVLQDLIKNLKKQGKSDWDINNDPQVKALKGEIAQLEADIKNGVGTMLPIFRSVVEKYTNLKTAKLVPNAVATYHVNPTTAKLNDYKLSFYTNTAIVVDEIESRNTGYNDTMAPEDFAVPADPNAGNGEVNEFESGVLKVPFKIKNWENYVEDLVYYFDGVAINQKTKSKVGIVRDSVNFIALQMTKGDTTTITSDYAAVVPSLIHINAIADNGPENPIENRECLSEKYYNNLWTTKMTENANHMYTYAQEAIDNEFTHTVAYNDTLDIMPFVETHFTYIGATSMWSCYDQRMDKDTFKKLGLKYVFSVVDYEDGNHRTGESRHISIEAHPNAGAAFGYDKVNLIPRSVVYDKDGKSYSQIKDEVAGREAIDREPLIKVEIVDPNNNVIEVGYIKLLITDNYKQYAFDLTIDDDYWMNCTDNGGLKWSQIEENILHVLNYTKTQFEAEYEIDLIAPGSTAKRFVKKDGKFVVDDNATGDVYYTKPTSENDPESKQTNVIKWYIGDDWASIAQQITGKDNAEAARQALMDNKGDGINTMYTTIRFVKKVVDDQIKNKEQYKDMTALYVTLNIPGPNIHFAYGEVTKKDLAHWYRLNSYKAGSEQFTPGEDDTNLDILKKYAAIDILENVPTPAEQYKYYGYARNLETSNAYGYYRTNDFQRPLYENFLKGMVNIDMGNVKVEKDKLDPEFLNKKVIYEYTDKNNELKTEEKKIADIIDMKDVPSKPEGYLPRMFFFDKYVYTTKDNEGNTINNRNVDFQFTLPVKGVNAEFSHNNGTWKVKGISGKEYTLKIGKNQNGEDNKGIWDDCKPEPTLIAQIVNGYDGDWYYVPYIRMMDNDCANDILNYAGRYDANGANMANESESNPFYLNNPEGDAANRQTFTTYLKIVTNDECYSLLLKNPYFNAKFLRPINVWGGVYEWNDAFNKVQTLYPSDLLTAKDWRNYDINLDVNWTNSKDMIHNDYNYEFAEGTIGWDFYNIYAVTIDYNEIYTDHAAEKGDRDAIAAGFTNVKAGNGSVSDLFKNNKNRLSKAADIPSLKRQYLNVASSVNRNIATTVNVPGRGDVLQGYKVPQTVIEYTNNGGNVQDFHLFVPVYVEYAWGHTLNHYNGAPNTFKVWTVIKVHQTTGAGAAAAKKN